MKATKIFALAFALAAALTACTPSTSTKEQEVSHQSYSQQQSNPDENSLLDDNGRLSSRYSEALAELLAKRPYAVAQTALYDIDQDDLPEIILIPEGDDCERPCEVYSADGLALLGDISGFCPNGFTRFSYGFGGTVMHNYCEHEDGSRLNSHTLLTCSDGEIKDTFLSDINRAAVDWSAHIPIHEESGYNDDILYSCAHAQELGDHPLARNAAEHCVIGAGTEVIRLYNSYLDLRDIAIQNSGTIDAFMPDDFDSDGSWEAFCQDENGLFFISCTGSVMQLTEQRFYGMNKLYSSYIILSTGTAGGSDTVYSVKNGKPYQHEISGCGQQINYSSLYNGGIEAVEAVLDGMVFEGDDHNSLRTSKKYQFFFDKSGCLAEYGSIEISRDMFLEKYGSEGEKYLIEAEEQNGKILEILLRKDDVLIINWRKPIEQDAPEASAFNQHYTMLKLHPKGLAVIERSNGRYRKECVSSIAVYPDQLVYTADQSQAAH